MAQVKPMLGEIELQLVQKLDIEGTQVLAEHSVPALEGDFLQGLGRRATRITLNGVLTGADAGMGLKDLREKFRAAEPVSFVADINTATKVDKVLIERMDVKELAGKPERFEYAFTLREYIPATKATEEVPPEPKPPEIKTDEKVGALIVEVIVEDQPDYDFSKVTVMVEGKQEDGTALSPRPLTNRAGNIWTEEKFPAGDYVVEANAESPHMTGSAPAQVQTGQTTNVTIILHSTPASNIAKTFIVHFRFDKAFVEPCMRSVLKQVGRYARDNPEEKLAVLGHTDKSGTDKYNQNLSERRSRAVYGFLTFGTDDESRASALDDWNNLRQKRPASDNELPSIKDSWGVREYQHMLQDLGFYPGPVDGIHGKRTDEAVRAYRCHKGLPPGTNVDDDVWQALIEDYLDKDKSEISMPKDRFFQNCPAEIFKWTGCGENDPLDRRDTAFRPSRRVELIFVRSDKLPCEVPKPVTFDLPAPGAVNTGWCIGPQAPPGPGCCLVTPALKPGTNDPLPCTPSPQEPWCRQPADPSIITVVGSIKRENPDGKSDPVPVPDQEFVLISSRGRFKADELPKGEPVPARTAKDGPLIGTFSFENMPAGFYSLEVITPQSNPVLIRLADKPGQEVKGNAVCTELNSSRNKLDILIINAPVLRQIRVPAVAHLVRPIDGRNHNIRQCPGSSGAATDQETLHTDTKVQQFFDGANDIWLQARVRFELTDLVHEAYTHPISDPSIRGSCEVDEDEFKLVLSRSSYPDCVNVFFFKDFVGTTEAGMGISVEDGAADGLPGGCALADQIQTTFGGVQVTRPLTPAESTQVLAHELGHYLNLGHADDTPANAGRLMLPNTLAGTNKLLIPEEVASARTSQAVTDNCVPLWLKVTGATQVGGSLSSRFIIVQDPGKVVTVDADIPDRLLDPGRGALIMTGGNPGANDRQRTVSAAGKGEVEVVAIYTPVGGSPVIKRVLIDVVTFDLGVEGAVQAGGAGSTTFVASKDAASVVIVRAQIDPSLFFIPMTLVSWTNGDSTPDPLRRTVSRANIAQTTVNATMAGVTRSVTIVIIEVKIAEISYIGKNQDADVTITINPDPLPAGVFVTLELTTTKGTGEARFASNGSKTMIIAKSSIVTIRGITESSEIDNIRLTAWITDQNHILAHEDFTVFYAVVTEIDFQSGIDIYNAASNARIPASGPEWRLSPATSYPAAYVRTGGGIGLSRSLRIRAITTPGLSGTFVIKADGPPGLGLAIGEVFINFSNGVASDVPMQFTALPSVVKCLKNISLQWRCKLSSWTSFIDINASAHTLYILDALPLSSATGGLHSEELYPDREFLDFTCSCADGSIGPSDVFNRIWTGLKEQKTGWTYYGYFLPNEQLSKTRHNARELIIGGAITTPDGVAHEIHDGDCDAWANFMVGCCHAHGIEAITEQLFARDDNHNIGIIVWEVIFGTAYEDGPPRVSFLNSDPHRGIRGLDPSPKGLPGQNMETPGLKTFSYHAVVRHGNPNTYYDPAYMRTWRDITEFRNNLAAETVYYKSPHGFEWPVGSGQLITNNGKVFEKQKP